MVLIVYLFDKVKYTFTTVVRKMHNSHVFDPNLDYTWEVLLFQTRQIGWFVGFGSRIFLFFFSLLYFSNPHLCLNLKYYVKIIQFKTYKGFFFFL